MPTTEEIQAYYNSLSPEAQRRAIEAGDLAMAIQQSSLTPLQQYTHPSYEERGSPYFPQSEGTVRVVRRTPEGSYVFSQGTEIGQSTVDEEIRQGRLVSKAPMEFEGFTLPAPGSAQINPDDPRVIKAAPPQLWSGGMSVEDLPFKERLKEKYEVGGGLPGLYENRLSYSQARSYMANLSRDPTSSAYISTQQMMNKERQAETEYTAWVAMGKPPLVPDEFTPPLGGFTFAQWDALTGLDRGAFAPGTTGLSGLRPDFVKTFVPGGKTVDTYATPERIAAALGGGEGAWGGGEPKSVRMQTGEEWGRQKADEWNPWRPAPSPTPSPSPDVILRDLARPPPVGDEYNPEHPSNVISSYPSGGKIAPAMGFTGPDPTLAMFSPPSSRRGMDTLAALGVPLPVMGPGKASPPHVGMPPPMSRRDVAEALFTPWGQAEILFGGVQKAGQGIRESFGRAGDYYIRQVAGVKPPPRMEVGAPSGDAEKFFAGTSVETRETVVPGFGGGFNPDTGKMEGVPEIRTIQTTERPWVQGEVRMTGRPGQNVKEAFLGRLAGPAALPEGAGIYDQLMYGVGTEAKATHEAAKRDAMRISIPRTPFFIDIAQPGRVIKEVGSGLSLVPEFIGAAGGGLAKFSGQIVKEPKATVPLIPAAAVAGVVTLGSGLVSIPVTIGAKAATDPAAAIGFTAGLAAPGMFGGLRRTKTAGTEVRLTGGGPETPIFEMALPRGQSTMGSIYPLPEVVKARVMGRGWDPVLQVWESEKGALRFPETSLAALEGTAASELIPQMKFETLREVTLEKGRTAEMQIPGNIEMRGSMRAWNKGVGGFHNWLNKMGEEALAEWQPRKIKFVQDSPLLTKGELGATIFKKGQSYAEPQTLIVASEQFPSLRGWDARLDNSQFAKAYWETESREMVDTIGHEFRHSIQPFYYNWKPENYAKTRGLLEYDAERFAEQARAAWEAEVGPAVPERVYIHRNLEPEVGAVAKLIETPVVTLPLTKQTFELIQPLSPEGIGVNPLKADFFVPPTKAGAKLVQGAPKGLFKPVYETVKTAEPWMKGSKSFLSVGTRLQKEVGLPATPQELWQTTYNRWTWDRSKWESNTLYHQTSKVSAEFIKQEGFRTDFPMARRGDYIMPDAVFLKPEPGDIGVGASGAAAEQIPVSVELGTVKKFKTLQEFQMFLDKDPIYYKLKKDAIADDVTRAQKIDKLSEDFFSKRRRPEQEHKVFDKAIEEIIEGGYDTPTKARQRATEYLKEQRIDTIIVDADVGSFGRSTKTIAILDPTKAIPYPHRISVAKAVAEGKTIPTKVLSDYPDLADIASARIINYPIVRPQSLLEKITRRPAEEYRVMPQKRLLGYEAQTSGALTDFLYGKEAPAGSEIRMRSFELDLPKAMDFGKMGDVTGTEGIKLIGASARATAKAMMEDVRSPVVGAGTLEAIRPAGRLQGLKERVRPSAVVMADVALGGVTSKGGLKYLVTSDFELAAKNIPGATATPDYLTIPFSGKFRVPELKTPLMSEAVNPTVTVRPGFDPRAEARKIMARLAPAKKPLDFRVPGGVERFGGTKGIRFVDKAERDVKPDLMHPSWYRAEFEYGGSKKKATGGVVSGSLISDAGPRSGAGPRARQAMGIYTGERYGRTKVYEILDVPSEGQGFGFRMEPMVRESLSFRPSATMLGATGIMAGTKGRFGVSEVNTLSQKEITRIIDKVMVGQAERARPDVKITFKIPDQKGRQDLVGRVGQLERQGQIPIVGSKEIQKLIDRVVDRTDQGEKVKVGQDVIQKVDIYIPIDTGVPPPDVPPPPQWPPPPVPRVPIIPPWRLPGGGNYGRGGRSRFYYSEKRNPIISAEELTRGLLPPKPKRGRGLFKGIFLTPPTRRKKKR